MRFRAVAARCKLPFVLRPGLSHEDEMRTKEIPMEKSPNESERQKKETKERAARLLVLVCGCHERGRG